MHAKFCVKRPNGVGVVFTEDRHTEDTQKTDRMKMHAPFSPLGPFTVVNYSVGIKINLQFSLAHPVPRGVQVLHTKNGWPTMNTVGGDSGQTDGQTETPPPPE